jgi:hypothetical protein
MPFVDPGVAVVVAAGGPDLWGCGVTTVVPPLQPETNVRIKSGALRLAAANDEGVMRMGGSAPQNRRMPGANAGDATTVTSDARPRYEGKP